MDPMFEMPEQPMAPPLEAPVQAQKSSRTDPLYFRSFDCKTNTTRVKNRSKDPPKTLGSWLFENQFGFSFNLVALLFLSHICIPKARTYTSKFFMLSHFNPRTGKYAASFDDVYFMTFCVVLLTGLRAGVMDHILTPLAKLWGVSKSKLVTRFSEQAWLVIYCTVFWSLGMYIYCNSPYYLNMGELWTNFPDRELSGLMKGYILAQWSYWIQQIIVIHIEERRKDHWQMLTHHLVTIALISASYAYHQIKVGHLIMVCMDTVDIVLPLAKCMKYLGRTTACDALFGLFIVVWVLTRHAFFLMICWSIHADIPGRIPPDCFSGNMNNLKGPFPRPDDRSYLLEPFYNPEGKVCLTENVIRSFLCFLLFLQAILIAWFVTIVQIVTRVLKGDNVKDDRSDDEDEEESIEYEEAPPLEEEVGVEDIDLKGWERRARVERAASSSGVKLPGYSDSKELLNRVGCETQIR